MLFFDNLFSLKFFLIFKSLKRENCLYFKRLPIDYEIKQHTTINIFVIQY